MPADWTTVQGDSGDALKDTLTYSDGTSPDLTGATLRFVARSLTSTAPLTLAGLVTSPDPPNGKIVYTTAAGDTNLPGAYECQWVIVFPGGAQKTFPTVGKNSWLIEQNLTSSGGQQLVSLPDVKDYLATYGVRGADRSHDAKLTHLINAATPIIENAAGPIIVREYEEWHDGGQYWIRLLRRPSTAIGCSPVIQILGCDEYRGPTKYPLSVVSEPSAGSTYSVMLDARTGTLYRRSTGGGVVPFGAGAFGGGMPQSVHVTYEAGQQSIPENVRTATLEAIRHNYETSQPTGRGMQTVADEDSHGHMLPFFLPPISLEMLSPMRRHPAIA